MNDNFNTRMILTTAVFAAVAALLVGPASAHVMDVEGGGGSGSATAMAIEAVATAPAFPSGHQLDTAIGTAIATQAVTTAPAFPSGHQLDTAIGTAVASQASPTADPWGGQVSLGLTGDSPISRVVGQEPAGLTGDGPRTRGPIYQPNATSFSSSDSDVNWTWVGLGAGMAALLAAAMGALYLTARHRSRVALP